MSIPSLYYLWALLLTLVCAACWFGTLLTLPGNWGILAAAAIFAYFVRGPAGEGISWGMVGSLAVLAILGEVWEGLASAAGAAQRGASRRGMAMSLVGATVGSILGVAIGLPLPVIGSAVAALVGGGVGAFLGAAFGEHWKGQPVNHQIEIGRAALFGRLWGTLGKLVVGIVMLVLVAAAAFV